MAQEKARQYKRRLRDKIRYCSNVSILSTMSVGSEANWKMRVPSLRANQLPEELLEVYEEAFYLLDPNDTGAISEKEVGIVMRALGQDPTDEEIHNLVQEVDRSGTGCLNFQNFLAFLSHISQDEDPDEEWETVFERFDRNGDGYIDENDLRKTLIELRLKFTDADVEEMICEFLPNKAKVKRLDFDDFLNIVT
uniref:Calmodulin-alpha-like n=1 Tax=Phallusia mammillata TaxID=59560 RepID=A0A6F9D822_9ASCI|nr:calmodulin-alpha-like [Phallusia mammillata]